MTMVNKVRSSPVCKNGANYCKNLVKSHREIHPIDRGRLSVIFQSSRGMGALNVTFFKKASTVCGYGNRSY